MRWWADVRGNQQAYDAPFDYDSVGPARLVRHRLDQRQPYGGIRRLRPPEQRFRPGSRRIQADRCRHGRLRRLAAGRPSGPMANSAGPRSATTWTAPVHLGPATRVHSGSPDGDNLSPGGSAGWNFGDGGFRQYPVLAVLSQKISVDGYAENRSDPVHLAGPSQDSIR